MLPLITNHLIFANVRQLANCILAWRQVDKTQLMDVLKEEPSFSHDHFSEVKAASSGQIDTPVVPDASGNVAGMRHIHQHS